MSATITLTTEQLQQLIEATLQQHGVTASKPEAKPEAKEQATLADLTIDEALVLFAYAATPNAEAGKRGKKDWLASNRGAALEAIVEHYIGIPEGSGESLKEAAYEVKERLEATGKTVRLNGQNVLPLFGLKWQA